MRPLRGFPPPSRSARISCTGSKVNSTTVMVGRRRKSDLSVGAREESVSKRDADHGVIPGDALRCTCWREIAHRQRRQGRVNPCGRTCDQKAKGMKANVHFGN